MALDRIRTRLAGPTRALPLLALALGHPIAAQEPPDTLPPDSVVLLPELTVPIGRLRVGAVPAGQAPFAVQSVTVVRTGAGLAEAVGALPGVTLGNQTGSAHQSDLRVRGFAVSPVVGLPQSLSVFVDGVRVNEADASQVHLSLIPDRAIERVELVRGPVGAFGKNALAGALNIVTARAEGDRSIGLELERASFGTRSGTLRAQGQAAAVDALLVGSYGRSEGWRDLEGAREASLFGKVGWRGTDTDVWLSYTFESDSLAGPGPLPESWIEGGELPADIPIPPSDRRKLQYTGGKGDALKARLHFLNSRVERRLSDASSLHATAFLRRAAFRQSNDNITEPDALGVTDIHSTGLTAQWSYDPSERLLVVVGAEGVRNRVDIDIRELPNRAFPMIAPATTELLRTDEDNLAGFAEAWWGMSTRLALHASLRLDYTSLPVTDLLEPEDSGANTFRELTGGLGLSADMGGGFGAFAGYGRGFRAPVILEVSCADPDDPCQLPFELGPDPPLRPVTSDNWQAGIRLARPRVQAELVGYWSEVSDDIFNVVDLTTPTRGFFTNLEKTRRTGAELFLEATPIRALPGLSISGGFGWTRATFESEATLSAPFVDDDDQVTALQTDPGGGDAGELEPPEVEPGDRFPMVPPFSVDARIRYGYGSTLVALEGSWVDAQFLVGDEGNEAPFAELDGYAVIDARIERRIGDATAYLEVANALDADVYRFGIISGNGRGDEESVERFLTPGHPRSLRIGLRVRVGG